MVIFQRHSLPIETSNGISFSKINMLFMTKMRQRELEGESREIGGGG